MTSTNKNLKPQNNTVTRPLFSAEKARLAHPGNDGHILADIQAQLAAMRQEIAALTQKGSASSETECEDAELDEQKADLIRRNEEIQHLRTELRALSVCINQTKAEIASIHPDKGSYDHLVIVSNELDAVVSATEMATTEILDVVETVEVQIGTIKSHTQDAYIQAISDDVIEKLVAIYEACNFQDITGQRITKVVNTLKFVEERISSMIRIWGEDSLQEAVDSSILFGGHRPGHEDNHLLNGPQLEGSGCNQADIDALFS